MTMQIPLASCVLFAAGFDWLEALLPFLFVAFWIVSQVFAVFRRLQGGGQQQPQPPRPRFDPARDRPRPPQPAAEGAGDLRSDLEKQIAEFLREATGEKRPQPTGNQRPVNQPPVKKSEPVSAPRPQSPRPDRRADSERQGPQTPRAAAPGKREQKKAVAPRDLAARPPEMPPQPQQPQTESVARHVQDAFSHELTHLRGTIREDDAQQGGGTPRPMAPTQAEELVHLLRSPATIRQVILLREILDRPVDRW
jgi:hypothetical protein